MIIRVLAVIIAPLLSLIIVTLGSGLFNTLVTVRLHLEGQPSWMIGLVTSAYYGGLVLGSFRSERLISRIGHIRAYAVIASVLAAANILQGMILNPWVDTLLRFVCGMCMAGIYIVVESWMLERSSLKTRGQVLGIYMMALYGAQATGQFLLNLGDPKTIFLFCLVAVLTSLSVIPITLINRASPSVHEPSMLSFKRLYKISPAGIVASLISGLILASIYGLMPLFVSQDHYTISHVALVMSMIIYGGMALQYPVGKLSDNFDRRRILLCISVFATILAAIILFYARYKLNTLIAFGFLFGGFTFTMYPLAVSLACDNVKSKDLIAATQGLLLAYGLGATLGPLIASLFLKIFNNDGLMIYFICLGVVLSLFLIWQDIFGRKINVARQQEFVPLTRTSPIANELDPRSE